MNKDDFSLALFSENETDSGNTDNGMESEETSADTDTQESVEAEDTFADEDLAETTDIGNDPDSAIRGIADLFEITLSSDDIGKELLEQLYSYKLREKLTTCIREKRAEYSYMQLIKEAEALSFEDSGFDLATALSDKRFPAMIHSGLSVKEAWDALNHDSILDKAVKAAKAEAERNIMNKLSEIVNRPDENGGSGASPAKSETAVESLTGKGIRDILRRVEKGAKIKF